MARDPSPGRWRHHISLRLVAWDLPVWVCLGIAYGLERHAWALGAALVVGATLAHLAWCYAVDAAVTGFRDRRRVRQVVWAATPDGGLCARVARQDVCVRPDRAHGGWIATVRTDGYGGAIVEHSAHATPERAQRHAVRRAYDLAGDR